MRFLSLSTNSINIEKVLKKFHSTIFSLHLHIHFSITFFTLFKYSNQRTFFYFNFIQLKAPHSNREIKGFFLFLFYSQHVNLNNLTIWKNKIYFLTFLLLNFRGSTCRHGGEGGMFTH